MSAGSSYVPAAVPACAYAPVMTLAAAIALRDAGTLNPNCVLIVPGPNIGPAASATTIEFQPATANDLGQAVLVHTTYDNSAWRGLFDPDLGANGTLYQLTDNRGNTAQDIDVNAPTVTTQFPWGNVNYRDCFAKDASLIGANTQVGTIQNTRFVSVGVDLTGKTGGNWNDVEIIGGTLNLAASAGVFTLARSRLYNVQVNRQATALGALSISDCDISGSTITQAGGAFTLSQVDAESLTLTNPAGATRPLVIAGLKANNATITQQRTGVANGDTLSGAVITGGSALIFTGTTDAGVPVTYAGLVIEGLSTINAGIGVVGNANPLRAVTVQQASTLNLNTGGQLQNCRIGAGATVNSGAFAHIGTIIELSGVTTLTAANVDRLRNKSFSDVV